MLDHKKIKKIRLERGLTQAELSELSDLTISTISNIENDNRDTIAGLTLKKLSKALKVKPAELLK